MTHLPLVSIVIPAYNHGRFLRQAIDSVLAQQYQRTELIVLDDGSTDDTRAVLEAYGRRFRWESQSNMGQAATLNKGWGLAAGEILGYVSADDYLHPRAAQRAAELLTADASTVLAYPDFEHVDEQGRHIRRRTTPEYDYMAMLVSGVCPPGPGAFLRRSALEAAGGWDGSYRLIPDFECWLRLGLRGQFRRIPEVLGYYRIHRGAQSFAPVTADTADEFPRAIEKLFGRPDLPGAVAAVRSQAQANALLYAARLHLMSGRTMQALTRARQALGTHWGALLWPRTYRLLLSGAIWRMRIGAT